MRKSNERTLLINQSNIVDTILEIWDDEEEAELNISSASDLQDDIADTIQHDTGCSREQAYRQFIDAYKLARKYR